MDSTTKKGSNKEELRRNLSDRDGAPLVWRLVGSTSSATPLPEEIRILTGDLLMAICYWYDRYDC